MTDPLTAPEQKRDWSEEAKGLLKAELKRRNISYAGLVAALAEGGTRETEANLRNKISRGNFSAAFFLECLHAIGCGILYLNTDPLPRAPARISPGLRKRYAESRKQFEEGQDDGQDPRADDEA